MRLRDSIRPPKRFDAEEFYTPDSYQPHRRAVPKGKAQYIDFNPDLPPAAFPTLEWPRVSEVRKIATQNQENGIQPMEGVEQTGENNEKKATDKENENEVDFEHVPMDELENYVASNAELNPIYVRNMAIMEASEEDPYMDMEDSDEETMVDLSGTEVALPTKNHQWSDLSPKMKLEIFNNLLEHYSFLTVCRMLGLSDEEREELVVGSRHRNELIKLENAHLEAMSAKQKMALLRLNHTALKHHDIPHQLVLRKLGRHYGRVITAKLGGDYLLCQSGELLAAREFLHRRGIERSYAGDWNNNLVTLRAPETDSEPETFEWKENLEAITYQAEEETPEPLSSTPCRDPGNRAYVRSMASRQSYINDTGEACFTVNPRELIRRKGNLVERPRWYENLNRELKEKKFEQHKRDHAQAPAPKQGSGLVRLKIGTERAAQIRNSERSYLNQDNVFYPSFGNCYASVSPEPVKPRRKPGLVNRPFFPNSDPVFPKDHGRAGILGMVNKRPVPVRAPQQPVQRTMGGAWSYNSVENSEPRVTPALVVRQRLERAKQDALRDRMERENRDNISLAGNQMRNITPTTYVQQQIINRSSSPFPMSSPMVLHRNQTLKEGPVLPKDKESTSIPPPTFKDLADGLVDLGSSSPMETNLPTSTPKKDKPNPAEPMSPAVDSIQEKHVAKDTDEQTNDTTDDAGEDDEMILLPNGETKNDTTNTK